MTEFSQRTQRWYPTSRDERGITQVELLIAVVLIAVLAGAVFVFLQVGMVANARVSAQARYAQDLALCVDQIVDGSGSEYMGMRSASAVQNRSGGGFRFEYSGALQSHTESYWVTNGQLFRSVGEGDAQKVTRADSLSIEEAHGQAGIYAVSLSLNVGSGSVVEYSTQVRLRNRAK